MKAPIRVAVVISHPIQHFCPQYKSWAGLPGVDLKVFFASTKGQIPYEDKGFGRAVTWELQLDFPHEFLHGADGKDIGNMLDAPDLAARLNAFSPNVVVAYGYSQRLQRRALRWAYSAEIPVLMVSDSELRRSRNFPKRAVKALVLPRFFKKVRLFLTAGDANEAYYRNYGISDRQFIRCSFPIDSHYYDRVLSDRDEHRSSVRKLLNIPEHHKVLLTVGKFVPWKRQADLIRFSNHIQNDRKDVTVVLVGAGPTEKYLRALARRTGSGGLVFAGFVPPRDLPKYYCAADVYVHCSEHEPHSLAISEAIYCALPAVVSDRCGSYGPTDDVRQGLNGFVYKCGDLSDMARHLKLVLDANADLAAMGDASQRIARQHQDLAHGIALMQALATLASSW